MTDHPGARATSDTRAVVVAARGLPVGHRLGAHDLRLRSWPTRLIPAGTSERTDHLIGKTLAAPVARGEAMSPRRVVGRDLTSHLGPDQVATVVGVDGPNTAALIRAGDRIDVLGSPARDDTPDPEVTSGARGKPPRVLVEDATVLAVIEDSGEFKDTVDVVVATTRDAAARLVRARSSQMFTILPRSP